MLCVLQAGCRRLKQCLLQAFEAFRKSYRKNEVIDAQKQALREKYSMAKATGEAVNAGA